MKAHLVLRFENQKEKVVSLENLPLTMGRGREADLTLASPMVSRQHCELYEVDGVLCIRDLGSLNGTFVGGDRVNEASLESGDILTVGSATFDVVVGDAKPSSKPEKLSGEDNEITELDDSSFEFAGDAAASGADSDDGVPDFMGNDVTQEVPGPKDSASPISSSSPAKKDDDEDLDDFLQHFE